MNAVVWGGVIASLLTGVAAVLAAVLSRRSAKQSVQVEAFNSARETYESNISTLRQQVADLTDRSNRQDQRLSDQERRIIALESVRDKLVGYVRLLISHIRELGSEPPPPPDDLDL